MTIKYLGHSAFLLKGSVGLVFDPFNGIGYDMERVSADSVICSHEHFDHNFVDGVDCKNKPVQNLITVNSFHDNKCGELRGKNKISLVEIDGIKVCHMGDLGEDKNLSIVEKIGQVDLLLIPVGGNYTIDAQNALWYINAIKPKIAIPMHYKTKSSKIDIAELKEFTDICGEYKKVGKTFNLDKLPSGGIEIIVME